MAAELKAEVHVAKRAGLLHDIGKMLLAPYLRDRGVKMKPSDDRIEVECGVVGLGHGRAG